MRPVCYQSLQGPNSYNASFKEISINTTTLRNYLNNKSPFLKLDKLLKVLKILFYPLS